jgi:hypothetical protein
VSADAANAELLRRLRAVVAPAVGRRLLGVTYWALVHECTAGEIAAGVGYIGGEVELAFDGVSPLLISWAENAGWENHFSIAVGSRSHFGSDALVPFPANAAPEWAPHVDAVLKRAECLGDASSPDALVFHFPSGAVLLADGQKNRIGDGDDLMVRPFSVADARQLPKCYWNSG